MTASNMTNPVRTGSASQSLDRAFRFIIIT
jgi:hypothetical protein